MTPETVAYHEAGHAVVALLQRFNTKTATIKAKGVAAGCVTTAPRGRIDYDSGTPGMRDKIERQIIVTLAGDIAQRKFAPRSSRRWHTTQDRRDAATLALAVCGSGESATAYIAWLHIRARDIVHGRWNLVEQVARLLLEKGTVTGEEIRAAILPPYQKNLHTSALRRTDKTDKTPV